MSVDMIKCAEEVSGVLNTSSVKFEFDNTKELSSLIVRIKEKLRSVDAWSMGAVEVGEYKRVFCLKFKDEIRTFINPKLRELSDPNCAEEIGVDGKRYLVLRANEGVIDYTDPLGEMQSIKLKGKAFRECQIQLERMDGIECIEYGLEIDEDFDNATEEEKDTIMGMYIDSLNERGKALEDVIQADEDLLKMKDAVDYMAEVSKGKIFVRKSEVSESDINRMNDKIDEYNVSVGESNKQDGD